MIDQNKIDTAVTEFLKNPYWAEYYTTAPSDNARKRIDLEFLISIWSGRDTVTDTEYSEAIKQIKELESKFTVEDCKHALKFNGKNPKMTYWIKKIAELGG